MPQVSTKEISIKELKKDELPLLLLVHNYEDTTEMLCHNSSLIDTGAASFYALFFRETIVGELRVKYADKDPAFALRGKRVYLYALRIHKNYRRMGLATHLVKSVVDLLSGQGYTEITIGVEDDNTVAHHIYESLGFNTFIKRVIEEYQGDKYEYNLYLRKNTEDTKCH